MFFDEYIYRMNQPKIVLAPEKLLAGYQMEMSFAVDKTPQLFRKFMPQRFNIPHKTSEHIFLVNIFPPQLTLSEITIETLFHKWGTQEVSAKSVLPEGMDYFTLPGGHYAVFIHKGPASEFARTFDFIFGQWLPQSEWMYDYSRHRFELIPPGNRPDDPQAEEEIWIPVKAKQG
jgi:AraC family transcriptional regulator